MYELSLKPTNYQFQREKRERKPHEYAEYKIYYTPK